MFQVRKKNICFACVTVGFVLLASKYYNNVLWSIKQLCHSISNKSIKKSKKSYDGKECNVSLDKIILVDSLAKCDYAVQRIRCNMSKGLLGFDCEWVNEGPVSLLQLATHNGVCALFRLNKIGYVPAELKDLLINPDILKIGIGPFNDAVKITEDYDCQVIGTLDLRSLADWFSFPNPKSLGGFCLQYLGFDMDKSLQIRCSDWDADTLTNKQMVYAACDAYIAILIFNEIIQRARQKRSLWDSLIIYIKSLQRKNDKNFFDLPDGIIDSRLNTVKNNVKKNVSVNSSVINTVVKTDNSPSSYKSGVPTRSKPLYHNCYLQAPDGDILCTCDKKKAQWYVSKRLGEIVKEDPFTVKLKFEPSGRALGEVGKYYTQVKLNLCVACGTSNKFIRKNVVPREYRRYFPTVMKSHQSHDILLLCPACHEVSNSHDLELRRKLAIICDAPLSGSLSHTRDEVPRTQKMLQSAVKVLRDKTALPYKRRKELEAYVTKFTGYQEITPNLLDILYKQLSMELSQRNKFSRNCIRKYESLSPTSSQPHGLKVVRYFENIEGGLVRLERLWREHFLKTMKPQFLPELWSICHNEDRLSIRQIQNRIKPWDAKVAGINTSSIVDG